ncbi:unnamed protein product [Nesidiocoris tenuis]|uniref:G-protein coupled receptors family 1 profile domain-containing protein n=1 Tax=Nesidiocoris tenuis TaxID=355587 RepID=A0A6H5GL58_9HEMI|nr:unnamed protein product [Nesidiocoris tenuis]
MNATGPFWDDNVTAWPTSFDDASINDEYADFEDEDAHRSEILYEFITNGILLNVVGVLGIMGNVISMIILTRPQMRSSINYLLTGLARCDTVLILTSVFLFGIPAVYKYYQSSFLVGYYFRIYPFLCAVVYPIALMTQTVSVYLTLTVTLERFVAVCHPLRARSLCTYGRARIYVVVIIAFSVVYNLSRFWEVSIEEEWHPALNMTIYTPVPSPLRNNHLYISIYIHWLYLFFIYFFPFTCLAILNTAIYRQIYVTEAFDPVTNSSTIRRLQYLHLLKNTVKKFEFRFHYEFDFEIDYEFEFLLHCEFDLKFEFLLHCEFDFEFDYEFEFLLQCDFDFQFDYEFGFRFQSCYLLKSSSGAKLEGTPKMSFKQVSSPDTASLTAFPHSEKGEQGTAEVISPAEEGDRPGDDAPLRRRRFLHLQHPRPHRQRPRSLLRAHCRQNGQNQQSPRHDQFLGEFHNLRHIRRKVQTLVFQIILHARPVLRRRPRVARLHVPRGERRAEQRRNVAQLFDTGRERERERPQRLRRRQTGPLRLLSGPGVVTGRSRQSQLDQQRTHVTPCE